ncbi:sigma 54-interacting transcriptional regulator [Nannocystis pusilla]|uniref:sigma 54-interacting transcriptional regulator n=1 Tax=Nannocystis pusilla TaxID=889268 RepID=UPI003B820034
MEPSTPHTQQIRDPRGGVSLLRNPLRITVLAGPDRKLAREFTGDRVVIGTHDSCDLVLGDPTVSRQHLEITLVAHGWALHDLDSRNGTFIGDVRVGDVVVDRDTRVRIGGTELRLQPLRSTVEVPLPAADGFGPLLGRSPAMRRVFEVLGRVAGSDATVLVTGESGTGKEVAARAIHEASPRRDRPFVVVDCGGLPANLIESELYGHQRGAFTGATAPRDGAFVTADGGTLFLDEVGELPLELQTRLLGVLERRQVQPLGTSRPRSVDVRVIAATNRDLRKEVNRGGFRTDLYFRLAVVSVHLRRCASTPRTSRSTSPPCSPSGPRAARRSPSTPRPSPVCRPSRGPATSASCATPSSAPSSSATSRPRRRHRPRRPPASPRAPSEPIAADPNIPFKVGKALLIEQFERSYITALMQRFDQNITRATRAAEIDRVYMLRLLDKYGLRPGRTRG